MDDPYGLHRFVAAQDGIFARACEELRAGRKATHWIWFVFPQIEGLGRSAMARRYAIGSLSEARAYASHPILAPRLQEATRAALDSRVADPGVLFGRPDDRKMRSSMTLFAVADPAAQVYREALHTFYGGEPDEATLERLGLPRDAVR